MNTIQFLKDRLLGKLVVLRITGTHVRICQGKRIPEYELPKTFQGYNYLNHAEEMAGWLQAILREERIQIRRFRIILDSEQVYLQTVKLPVMTVEEQKNWVFWEGSQYVPFEPGTYQAVLLRWTDLADFRSYQENRVTVSGDLSVNWQAAEKAKLQDYLLIAIPLGIVEGLQQFAGLLKAKLEEVTAVGPKQVELPVNLLPTVSRKEVALQWGYKAATVLCLLISVFLAVRSGIQWQHTKREWLEAGRQLIPLRTVKTDYNESKQTDNRIAMYRQVLSGIGQTDPPWSLALRTIGRIIPEGCWIDELQQKQTHSKRLVLRGCAFHLGQITEFLERLEQSGVFSEVRLLESGTQPTVLKNRRDNSKTIISFLLLAELAPVREGVMP